jgi:hypothetical protein
MAYARDPSAAFLSSTVLDSQPLLGQPVTYHNVTLAHSTLLEGHFTGQHVPVLQVDWRKGTARTFDSADDALNGICTYEGTWTCPPYDGAPLSIQQYVTETLCLLERGHSLLDPHCECRHGLNATRCQQLGVTPRPSARFGWCSLPRAPREFSAAELSQELAVHDVCLMPGMPFITAMEALCTIRVAADGLYFSPRGIFFGPVRCA